MSPTVLLPLSVALSATIVAALCQRYFRPALATWSLVLSSAVTAVAVMSGLLMLLIDFFHEAPWHDHHGHHEHWCLQVGQHDVWRASAGALIALVWLGVAAAGVRRVSRDYRTLVPADSLAGEVEVVPSEEPLAYTLPGPRGRIVVSRGMLDGLPPDEQDVLFAHEHSHRRHRHDRFIFAVDISAALVPPLAQMRRRVRYATERWADEDAARSVGDRRVVARAVSRAALLQSRARQPGLALAGLGVRQRVEQLLDEPNHGVAMRLAVLATCALTGVAVLSSTIQVHHLAELAEQFCL